MDERAKGYDSAVNKKLVPSATAWMDPEDTGLSQQARRRRTNSV